MKFITTSWDDGHELDFKLAALLDKYKLPGTFYIPKTNLERSVMSPAQVKELSRSFEIGGHTLSHIRLSFNDKHLLENEIAGSYKWLGDLLGFSPVSFCFPGGVFNNEAVDAVFAAGYKLARTTELISTNNINSNRLMPTSLQLYEHPVLSYVKNTIKRRRWHSLLRLLKNNSEKNIVNLTYYYLHQIEQNGGCFHLWGHSWEIEEYGLWNKMEEVFKIMSDKTNFICLLNKEILDYPLNQPGY
ncbi:MAG: polysaccharide deacetylase family protein [Ferruginibacter sp.]